ncbi:MAG: hypothetical protein R2771_07655 [Saprospiraceae bacterium]
MSDFKNAAERLPISYTDGSGEGRNAGRATKGAALGYLGKAQLFTGDFASAETTFKQVIDLGVYSLMDDYLDNFTDSNENNAESLFEVQFNREVGGVDLSWWAEPVTGWGNFS